MRILACTLAAAALLLGPAAASAHQGNPNYRSTVTRVTPPVPGVQLSVLNYDDRLALHNTSGQDITVFDYKGKPYAQVLADGTVRVNTASEAYYLNEDRTGQGDVPANLPATPRWKTLSRAARFEWHDHRMHWMGKADPPNLKDKNVRTKIFDWQVPVQIGARRGAIAGTLTWVPRPSSPLPLGAIFAFAALVIVLSIMVFVVRRRRAAGGSERPGDEVAEAW